MIHPINELKVILNILLGSTYYADEAPDNAVYPYRVGTFGPSFDDEQSEVFAFELDYWAQGKSYIVINERLRSDRTVLDYLRMPLTHGYAVMHYDSSVPIADADNDLRRVRASYTVRIYYYT